MGLRGDRDRAGPEVGGGGVGERGAERLDGAVVEDRPDEVGGARAQEVGEARDGEEAVEGRDARGAGGAQAVLRGEADARVRGREAYEVADGVHRRAAYPRPGGHGPVPGRRGRSPRTSVGRPGAAGTIPHPRR